MTDSDQVRLCSPELDLPDPQSRATFFAKAAALASALTESGFPQMREHPMSEGLLEELGFVDDPTSGEELDIGEQSCRQLFITLAKAALFSKKVPVILDPTAVRVPTNAGPIGLEDAPPLSHLALNLGPRFLTLIDGEYANPSLFSENCLKVVLERASSTVIWSGDIHNDTARVLEARLGNFGRSVPRLVIIRTVPERRDKWWDCVNSFSDPYSERIELTGPSDASERAFKDEIKRLTDDECQLDNADRDRGVLHFARKAAQLALPLAKDPDPLETLERIQRRIAADVEHYNEGSCITPLPKERIEELTTQACHEAVDPVYTPKIQLFPEAECQPSQKPSIEYSKTTFRKNLREAEEALLGSEGANPKNIFRYAGRLAMLERSSPTTPDQVQRQRTPIHARELDVDSLRDLLTDSAQFFERQGRGKDAVWIKSIPPDVLLKTIKSRRGKFAPPLVSLLPHPTICPDGRLITDPGYDVETGIFAEFEFEDFLPQPVRVDRHRAEKEYQFLRDTFFEEVAFSESVDAAVAVAALLTALIHKLCPKSPGFIFNSPSQSSGKTVLASAIYAAAFGRAPSVTDWPPGKNPEEELGKVMFSEYRKGSTSILFDNVGEGTKINSPTLAKIITSETVNGRILGKSDNREFPSPLFLMLSGINIAAEGDNASRFYSCRIDPKCERPYQRKFKRELIEWTLRYRAEIVRAALCIIQAGLKDGKSVSAQPSRFPEWDRMVRFPIIYAGGPDIAQKMERAFEVDSTTALLCEVIRCWLDVFGEKPLVVGAILKKLDDTEWDSAQDSPVSQLGEALRQLVEDGRGVKFNRQSLGQRLAQFEGRLVDGRAIESSYDSNRKQNLWSITPLGGKDTRKSQEDTRS